MSKPKTPQELAALAKKGPPGGAKKEKTFKEQVDEAFDLFDKNGDGTIVAKELPTIIQALGASPSDEELNALVTKYETESAGKVKKDQFVSIMSSQKIEENDEAELKKAFDIFDHDKSGEISAHEMRYVLKNFGLKLSPEEVEEMIDAADVNGDGKIDFPEFKKLLFK